MSLLCQKLMNEQGMFQGITSLLLQQTNIGKDKSVLSYLTIIQCNLNMNKHLVMQAVPCHPGDRAVDIGGKIEGEVTTAHWVVLHKYFQSQKDFYIIM